MTQPGARAVALLGSSLRAELLAADAPAWTAFLARSGHDFYHLPAYVSLTARQEDGEAVALHVHDDERELLLPLILRRNPDGSRDATSPYGYPGPLVAGSSDPGFVRDALLAGCELLDRERVVALFVRFHPHLSPLPADGVGRLVRHGDTVSIDLSASAEELWRQTRGNHRTQINRAMRAGLSVTFDEAWTHEEVFVRLYHETMRRVSAEDWYLFDREYFAGLREALDGRAHLAVVEAGTAIAAAGVFIETDGIVQYHLSGTDAAFGRAAPTKLLFHQVREWARTRGNRWFHLGGGLGSAADSLFDFKIGFSPLRLPFHTLRVVVREADYRTLVEGAGGTYHPEDLDGFFPRYRRV
jgi:CelD/BcsL family acetyltransferase involved in cellulose biosynthesis